MSKQHTSSRDKIKTGSTLKFTLVWTDPPSQKLVNDLDLMVRSSDGTELHGNQMGGSEVFDRVNNVERIFLSNIPSGPARITIRAHKIVKSLPQPSCIWVAH